MKSVTIKDKVIGSDIKNRLAPYCKRIEIAGSIRRECPEVNDIEIVLIPDTSKLYEYKKAIESYSKIKGGALGKYTQRRHSSGMKIDFFICTSETWACNYFIRTGSADFVYSIMKKLKMAGAPHLTFHKARLLKAKPGHGFLCSIENIFEETDVFKELKNVIGIEWIEPKNR